MINFIFIDANECLVGSDSCAQTCHNTAGSYTCSCNSGYRLNLDGHSCNGIRCRRCKISVSINISASCDQISMNVLKAVISAVNYVTILKDHTLVPVMMAIT